MLSTCACTETSSADTGSSSTSKLGPERQRTGDADPLALTAGELVRVATGVARREPDRLEQLGDPCAAASPRPSRAPRAVRRSCPAPSCAGSATRTDPGGRAALRPAAAQLARVGVTQVLAANCTDPDVGSIIRRMQRASVDLPLPLSPTIAERLSTIERQAHPVHRPYRRWLRPAQRPPRPGTSCQMATRGAVGRHGRRRVPGRGVGRDRVDRWLARRRRVGRATTVAGIDSAKWQRLCGRHRTDCSSGNSEWHTLGGVSRIAARTRNPAAGASRTAASRGSACSIASAAGPARGIEFSNPMRVGVAGRVEDVVGQARLDT